MSIQNIGGTAGFSGARVVRCTRGLFADAERKSFFAPFLSRRCITSSSLEG